MLNLELSDRMKGLADGTEQVAEEMLRIKNELELAKCGLKLAPNDPSRALRLGEHVSASNGDRHMEPNMAAESVPGVDSDILLLLRVIRPATNNGATNAESFARETLSGELQNVSELDNQALAAGIRAECVALRSLDANYPARYHRLGTYIIEARKRYGDEKARQNLRSEGVDSTRAWRAEQIATLYTFKMAVAFPSLRAILPKPFRQAAPKAEGEAQGRWQPPSYCAAGAAKCRAGGHRRDHRGQSIHLGIEVRARLGDGAFDQAVEQIKAHVPQNIEDAFVEVG